MYCKNAKVLVILRIPQVYCCLQYLFGMKLRFILFIVMVWFGGTVARTQDKGLLITGYVLDGTSHAPLSNVNISVAGTVGGTTSNLTGYFQIRVKSLPVLLYFSYVGYEVKALTIRFSEAGGIKVYLSPVTRQIGEVTITGERITNLIKGDTLNVLDYEIAGDNLYLVANPYKNPDDQKLYVMTFSGEILSNCNIRKAGHQVEDPELLAIAAQRFLYRDCFGEIQLLTRDTVWQIFFTNPKLYLIFPTGYADFFEELFPARIALDGKLVYQKTSLNRNWTYLAEEGNLEHQLLKTVCDPFGDYRYARPIDFPDGLTRAAEFIMKGSWERCVAAPVIKRQNDFLIFDFFGNSIDFFDFNGECYKSVPITFHLAEYNELFLWIRLDIDISNFTQQVIFDSGANRIWTLWKPKPGDRYLLKEINPETGQVSSQFDIPDYIHIDKIRIHNNIVYFLYTEKSYPFNRSLFRMTI